MPDGQEKQEKSTVKKPRSKISYAVEFVIYIALILLCVFWVPEHVIQRTVVNGESMEETLHDEESLLVEKVSYHFKDPQRYDIIVFHPNDKEEIDTEIQSLKSKMKAASDEDEKKVLKEEIEDLKEERDEYYVKRIFGLPGETIQIRQNEIFLIKENGEEEKLEDKYAKNAMNEAGTAEQPLTLGEDEYFVLGDNREVSLDSRDESLGPITKDKIAGKVILRILPFSKFGVP